MTTPRAIQFDAVADLYDLYVRADFDIPFWLTQVKGVRGKILELTCGTGRVSIPLLRTGANLTCVDYSAGMLAQLQRKVSEGRLRCPCYCQDMTNLSLPDRFELIIIPFHSFSEITDKTRQRLALTHIRSHLADQGRFICTLQNPVVRTASMDGITRLIGEFPLEDGGMLRVSARTLYEPSTHLASGEQFYERYASGKVLLEKRILGITFYLFDRNEFELLLTETGFSVDKLYGDYERHPFDEKTSPFMIWSLQKKEPKVKQLGTDK